MIHVIRFLLCVVCTIPYVALKLATWVLGLTPLPRSSDQYMDELFDWLDNKSAKTK